MENVSSYDEQLVMGAVKQNGQLKQKKHFLEMYWSIYPLRKKMPYKNEDSSGAGLDAIVSTGLTQEPG